MLRKGFQKCVTFVLAITFLMTSVISMPVWAEETEGEESVTQVQEDSAKVVQDDSEEESSEESSTAADNAASNAADIPENEADFSEESSESETTGGESSQDDVSDDAAVEEREDEGEESNAANSQESIEAESSQNDVEIKEAIEASMELESISLFSNTNTTLLSAGSSTSLLSAGANDSNMGLASGVQFYKYEIEYNKYEYNTVEYIVIHDTGNSRAGADAMAHYEYFSTGDRDASAHYFVDDGCVVQIIDDSEGSWHSGVKYKTPATPISNHNSIGIEMCINSDGDYSKAMKNTIDLAAYLLWKYDLDIDHMVRHYDANGKVCPLTMSDNNWAVWYEFKAAVKAKLKTYTGSYSGGDDSSDTSTEGQWYYNNIMGDSVLSADAMVSYLLERNTGITKTYAKQVANAYLTIGSYYGIRGDIAFFQAMLETGNLNYGGEVDRSYNNFCGMKAAGDTEDVYEYAKFATVEEGVEAHIQHLYCYASTEEIPSGRTLVDPRFGSWLRGAATTWEGLGGKWAQPGYDTSTYASLDEARSKHGSYGDIIIQLYVSAGGTGVQCDGTSDSSSSYWDDPIYTGPAAGVRDVLKIGSTGSDVKEIQGYLKTIGYSYVSVSGTFDSNTQRAVMDIQKKNNLDADGIVGENTWAAIINAYVDAVLGGNSGLIPPTEDSTEGDTGSSSESTGNTETGNSSSSSSSGSSSGSTGSGTSTARAILSIGSQGSDVKYLQQLLNQLGYTLDTDGIFGSGTYQAVCDFQTKNKLTVDGYVGENTWAALEKKAGSVSSSTGSSSGSSSSGSASSSSTSQISVSGRSLVYNGSSGSDVKALQQLLNQLGYKLDTDGIFGSETEKAVRTFQNQNGLDVDGYVGALTWKKLGQQANSSTSGSSSSSSSSSGSSSTSSSSGTISVSGRSLIYSGSTGADVTALQQLLNQLGYGLTVDGIFGSGTEEAVKQFQKKQNLDVDGYVGDATWKALGKACAAASGSSSSGTSTSSGSSSSAISTSGRSTLSYGSTGSDVTALQQLLNQHGYNLDTDGIFGSSTQAAVVKFQQANGLVADGIVGALTWAKL